MAHTDCKQTYLVTFSLVVYKQSLDELRQVVQSVLLYASPKKLYIVDNSPTDEARALLATDSCIVYHKMPQNVGFGRAHNWALQEALDAGSKYHYVVNPDITFNADVVTPMVEWLDAHPEVGQMMPRILYPNGDIQYLPKLMPTLFYLAKRKMHKFMPSQYDKWMQRFEMRKMRTDRVYDVGHVSGCFSVMRTEVLRQCGLYDDRYFMYFEDTDLTRRIHRVARTVYFPMVAVCHDYGNGASRNPKLFFVFLASLIKFFNKWGWFFDSERKKCNKEFLSQLSAE